MSKPDIKLRRFESQDEMLIFALEKAILHSHGKMYWFTCQQFKGDGEEWDRKYRRWVREYNDTVEDMLVLLRKLKKKRDRAIKRKANP